VRHVRLLGLCLVAMLVVGAYAVSSASALPEWGKCEAKTGGKFANSNCTEKAAKGKGAFEWLTATKVAAKRKSEGKSANIPFSGHNVGSGGVLTSGLRECYKKNGEKEEFFRTTRAGCVSDGGTERELFKTEPLFVECATENNTGEAEAKNKVANVHVRFTGCKALGSIPCESPGKAEAEVETSPLKGELGYISKSAKEVGVLLEPAKKHGLFAEFVCSTVLTSHVGVGNDKEGAEYTSSGCSGESCKGITPSEEKNGGYDGIISPITPVNAMTKEFTQVYTRQTAQPWENIPSKFENKHLEVLEDYFTTEAGSGDWSQAGEVITNVNTPEEEGEIKA
jgi:hypothetical protein